MSTVEMHIDEVFKHTDSCLIEVIVYWFLIWKLCGYRDGVRAKDMSFQACLGNVNFL